VLDSGDTGERHRKLVLHGNRNSDVALAVHHRLGHLSTYRLSGLSNGDKHST